jgi:rhodanese-related sulfurtransferase
VTAGDSLRDLAERAREHGIPEAADALDRAAAALDEAEEWTMRSVAHHCAAIAAADQAAAYARDAGLEPQ